MNFLQQFYPGDFVTWTVALVLVQTTFVIALAALVARLFARRGAAARYGVWFCALMCVLLCPLLVIGGYQMGLTIVSIPIPTEPAVLFESPKVDGEAPIVATDIVTRDGQLAEPLAGSIVTSNKETIPPLVTDVGTGSQDRSIITASSESSSPPRGRVRAAISALTLIWSVGVLFLFARMVRELRWVRVLRRDAQPLDDDRYATVLMCVRKRLSVSHLGKMAISQRTAMPLAIGLWRPTVLIPERLLSSLSETELEDVLVHECAHAVRRDLVVGLVQRILAILFWPHPLIHILNRRLSRAREEVCDNYVLQSGDAGRYAQTLLTVAQHITAEGMVAVGIGLLASHWKLEDRIAGLLDKGRNLMTRTNRFLLTSLFAALAITGVIISGVRLSEAVADEPDTTPTEKTADDTDETEAEPVEKDGLKVSVKAVKKVFEENEPLAFDVTYENVSPRPLRFNEAEWINFWTLKILPGPWLAISGVEGTPEYKPFQVDPKKKVTIRVVLNESFAYHWKGEKPARPRFRRQLSPGEYRFQPTIEHSDLTGYPDSVAAWVGGITPQPAKFTIVKKHAVSAAETGAKPAETAGLKEFTFDKLIVKVDSFAAPLNYTLAIQKDGWYVFQPFAGSDVSSRNRLPNTAMAQLEHLLKKADYMKEPSIEELATDSKKGLVDLIKRTRAKNPDDPAIRSYEFALRAAPGVGMASDGTWYTFTLVRDGEKRVLSRYNEELKRPPFQPLVRFIDRILLQEAFERAITGKGERVLLKLNLHLDRALGRRDVKSSPPLMALDYGGLAVRLKKLATGDDPQIASRAQRAIRMIHQLPDGDFRQPSAPIPPADADRLTTFRIFTLDLKGDGDEQQQLWIFPDGWYEFRITGPPKVTKYLRYRHVDRLPRKTLDRLDELIVATRHFRSQYGGHKDVRPTQPGIYHMAVTHEHDRGPRRMVSHREGQAEEYDNLQEFLTTQIIDLMKRKDQE